MRRFAVLIAVVLATVALVAALWKLHYVVVLLLLSLGLAAAVRPVLDSWIRKGVPFWAAMAGVYGLTLAALGLLIFLASPPLAAEVAQMTDDFTRVYAHFAETWPHGGWLQQNLAPFLPGSQGGARLTPEQLSAAVISTLGIAFNLIGLVIDGIIVVVLSIYWNRSRESSERLWLSLLPVERRAPARDVWHAIESEVGAYIRSELVQSLVAGLVLGASCWLIGFRYPVTLAIAAALGWLVPWVGIVLIAATVVVLSIPTFVLQGQTAGIYVGGLTMFVTQAIFLVLELAVEPRFFNRRRYNSFFTVLTVVLLGDYYGISGLLLGPPLAVALQVFGGQLLQWRAAAVNAKPIAESAEIRERVSSLRTSLSESESAPPEVASLVERLGSLADETLAAVSSG
jgi:predicted PurR-regulated permease PerM